MVNRTRGGMRMGYAAGVLALAVLPTADGLLCYGSNAMYSQDRWVLANSEPSGKYHPSSRPHHRLFYLDLAANEPECHSNTVRLERADWAGVCVEPNPQITPRLRARRNCTLVEAPIAATEREVTFLPIGEIGGIVGQHMNHASNAKNLRGITMKTRRLEDVLDSVGAPRHIDYFSLDVEGAEDEVLSDSFPFGRYKFLLLTVEQPPPPLNARLFAHGYLWVMNRHDAESFYVHPLHPKATQLGAQNSSFRQVPAKCNDERKKATAKRRGVGVDDLIALGYSGKNRYGRCDWTDYE